MSDLSSFNKRALLSGQLCLCGVAILWGSYSPVVRYIYSCSATRIAYTTATRGAFLIQATSLLTPVMATLAGEKPSRGVWLGCCCTLTGTVLITLDHSASAVSSHGSPAAASSLGGDTLILAAAFFYSVVTIRLGGYARRFAPVRSWGSCGFSSVSGASGGAFCTESGYLLNSATLVCRACF
ncbi:hypothetical protein WJX79_006922 [Trebouxia sp. C0005]